GSKAKAQRNPNLRSFSPGFTNPERPISLFPRPRAVYEGPPTGEEGYPMQFTLRLLMALAALVIAPEVSFAAEGHGLPGAELSLMWALPFAGILLCIATGPLFFPHVWEHHYGKISTGCAAAVIVPMILIH